MEMAQKAEYQLAKREVEGSFPLNGLAGKSRNKSFHQSSVEMRSTSRDSVLGRNPAPCYLK